MKCQYGDRYIEKENRVYEKLSMLESNKMTLHRDFQTVAYIFIRLSYLKG